MKKILVTGASGFVGGYFISNLAASRPDCAIHAVSRRPPSWNFIPASQSRDTSFIFHQVDLMEKTSIATIIGKIRPDCILHLAAQSSVGESWNTPAETFLNNVTIFLNILDAVRIKSKRTRILSVGSSEQYGIVSKDDIPVREERIQQPSNPYGIARVAQEQLAMVYRKGFDLDICCTRSFNHCGPGQSDQFVASAIAKQYAKIRKGLQDPIIDIGNGTIVRDFLDVRDVIAAYMLILEKGVPGAVYNVCSGRGYAINDLVILLADRLKMPIQIRQNPMKIRPQDNPSIIGSPEKLQSELGWNPHYSLADSLEEMVEYWEMQLRGGQKP